MAWATQAFGLGQSTSLTQRGLRLLEEAIEAFQSVDGTPDMAHKLVDFVFGRPPGALHQELGGVGVCMLVLAAAAGLSADDEEQREIDRVLAKPIHEFTKRNAAKNAAGFLAVKPHEDDGKLGSRQSGPRATSQSKGPAMKTFVIEFDLTAETAIQDIAPNDRVVVIGEPLFNHPPDAVVRYRIVVAASEIKVFWQGRDSILGEVSWIKAENEDGGAPPAILTRLGVYYPNACALAFRQLTTGIQVNYSSMSTRTTANGTPLFDLGVL